jgi:hypothetical protein
LSEALVRIGVERDLEIDLLRSKRDHLTESVQFITTARHGVTPHGVDGAMPSCPAAHTTRCAAKQTVSFAAHPSCACPTHVWHPHAISDSECFRRGGDIHTHTHTHAGEGDADEMPRDGV